MIPNTEDVIADVIEDAVRATLIKLGLEGKPITLYWMEGAELANRLTEFAQLQRARERSEREATPKRFLGYLQDKRHITRLEYYVDDEPDWHWLHLPYTVYTSPPQPQLQSEGEGVAHPDGYQNPTDEIWFDHPADPNLLEGFVDGLKVGDEYEIDVCWTGKQKFIVRTVNADGDVDEVDFVSGDVLFNTQQHAKPVAELALKAEIDLTRKKWLGRDYDHLSLPDAVGKMRDDISAEAIRAVLEGYINGDYYWRGIDAAADIANEMSAKLRKGEPPDETRTSHE